MNLHFTGETKDVEDGIRNLLSVYSFPSIEQEECLEIAVAKLPKETSVSLEAGTDGGLHLSYRENSNFFRALSILLQNRKIKGFEKQETARFEGCSMMVDLSRNAVYTVEELKRLLCLMALTGHNRFYMYMEDTYELPGYPYFGYLRGRYALTELKEIDDFAFSLGIEVIPCIQTLAHLKNALKWSYAASIKDTNDILLVGEEVTYRFIETMISTMNDTFRTNKIHIGMDEAMALGTGNYLKKHGYENQFELMIRHLNRVNEIVKKYGKTPIIWDDMFYRTHDQNHEYYNMEVKLSKSDIEQVPKNMALAFWDYYHDTEEEYDKLLAMRDNFSNDIIFTGGNWRWMGFIPGYSKTRVTTNAALSACKKHRVKEIMETVWGDDGAETPLATVIPGMILFGEHCFDEPVDHQAIDSRCRFLTGVALDDFLQIEQLDMIPGCENPNLNLRNPSKQALYQDLLLGAFDRYFKDPAIAEHYKNCETRLFSIAERAGRYAGLFQMYASMARVLAEKALLGNRIREAYHRGDHSELNEIAQTVLPQLKKDMLDFKESFTATWFRESKGQGFEIIDIRFGGLISRIDTVAKRLTDYLEHRISSIEELDETLLPFTQSDFSDEVYVSCNSYRDIVSQNNLYFL